MQGTGPNLIVLSLRSSSRGPGPGTMLNIPEAKRPKADKIVGSK